MTDNTELIARLRKPNSQPWGTFVLDCRAAADALAARDAEVERLTADLNTISDLINAYREWRAATFEVTE